MVEHMELGLGDSQPLLAAGDTLWLLKVDGIGKAQVQHSHLLVHMAGLLLLGKWRACKLPADMFEVEVDKPLPSHHMVRLHSTPLY